MMHTKAMVVDGDLQHHRLGQLRQPLVRVERRAAVGVYDAELAAQLTRDFEADLKSSKRLDAATWPKQRSFDGKINEWFWRLLRRDVLSWSEPSVA